MKNVVIVGVGELVQQVPEDLNTAFSPLDLMERAARMALKDTGAKSLASEIDTLAVVRTFSDSGAPLKSPFGDAVNPCLLYTSPSPRDKRQSRMPSSA